jgi:hypothetical protein
LRDKPPEEIMSQEDILARTRPEGAVERFLRNVHNTLQIKGPGAGFCFTLLVFRDQWLDKSYR